MNGGTPKTSVASYWEDGEINWATIADVKNKYLYSTKKKITKEGLEKSSAKFLPVNTILFSSKATIGEMSISKVATTTNQDFKNLVCNPERVNYEYLYFVLKQQVPQIKTFTSGLRAEITTDEMEQIKIPLPPLEVQEQIVREMNEAENREKTAQQEIVNLKAEREQVLQTYL